MTDTKRNIFRGKKMNSVKSVLLNGPSSSGKSSIARRIREMLSGRMTVGIVSIDDHLKMSPSEEIYEDEIWDIMPSMCAAVAASLRDNDLTVIDHVISSERIWNATIEAAGTGLFTVHVTCDPGILHEREAARGDRCPGSAAASYQYLYPRDGYDLTVDSGKRPAAACAEAILTAITKE
ncbi:MAG: hypothetical protein CW338_00375 [Clostridiales bacterium]|nr:hypothetical protein [Clostridiales bacterium]